MKLAASNIAWPYDRRIEAYAALARHGLAGVEVAPALLLGAEEDPFDPAPGAIDRALAEMADYGLRPVSMQSLLFGVDGAALFGAAEEQRRLIAGVERAVRLAAMLGIGNLVFGSPRQRVIGSALDREQALEHAAAIFRDLARSAVENGSVLALECNPPAYGTDFLTTLAETEEFVRRVDHCGIRMNFDTGAIRMNAEEGDVEAFLDRSAALVSHVHVSAPHLAPAPDDAAAAARLLGPVAAAGYAGWYSIEMRAPDNSDPIANLDVCAVRLAETRTLVQGLSSP